MIKLARRDNSGEILYLYKRVQELNSGENPGYFETNIYFVDISYLSSDSRII